MSVPRDIARAALLALGLVAVLAPSASPAAEGGTATSSTETQTVTLEASEAAPGSTTTTTPPATT